MWHIRLKAATKTVVSTLLVLTGISVVAFTIDQALLPDTVRHHTVFNGTSLGGMQLDEAVAELETYQSLVQTNRDVVVVVDDVGFVLATEVLSPTLQAQALADDTRLRDKQRSILGKYADWLASALVVDDITERYVTFDEVAFEQQLQDWDQQLELQPAFEGSITFDETGAVASYPRIGRQINRSVARSLLVQAVLAELSADSDLEIPVELRTRIIVPIQEIRPTTKSVSLDRLKREFDSLVSESIFLTHNIDQEKFELTPEILQQLFVIEFDLEQQDFVSSIDATYLEDALGLKLTEPEDAEFTIHKDQTISVTTSQLGQAIDVPATTESLLAVVESADRYATLFIDERAAPEFSTADAEAMNINHLVSSFTTYHPCCADRVDNIQLMADKVAGVIVAPGEEFSLNKHVGRRTEEAGFLPAGTIVKNELVDTVGGGVSQFATTLYNAVFWGGYEDVTHRPHSWYFSRYPEGVEATVSWPGPSLIFRNDSDAAVLIDTRYTPTSITVDLYGDNDGRTVSGRHRYGATKVDVVTEGGNQARRVSREVSERYDGKVITNQYVADLTLPLGDGEVDEHGLQGWKVDVTRWIHRGDQLVDTNEWEVRYSPRPRVTRRHPCSMPPNVDYSPPIPCDWEQALTELVGR